MVADSAPEDKNSHHYYWHYYQALLIIPLHINLIIGFVNAPSNYGAYHIKERFASVWQALNPFVWTRNADRLEDRKGRKPILWPRITDTVFIAYLCTGGLYYAYDIYIKILHTDIEHLFTICPLAFLGHHVFTLLSLRLACHVDHFPWYY